jgi:hypothetical protein
MKYSFISIKISDREKKTIIIHLDKKFIMNEIRFIIKKINKKINKKI